MIHLIVKESVSLLLVRRSLAARRGVRRIRHRARASQPGMALATETGEEGEEGEEDGRIFGEM
jgi:hypothetical protein